MKKLLIICAILTASISYSQDFIQITPDQAKQAIKNAQRIEVLEVAIQAQGTVISKLQIQVTELKEIVLLQESENDLLEKSNDILQTQLEAEKTKKPKFSTWEKLGIGAGAFLLGFFVSSISGT